MYFQFAKCQVSFGITTTNLLLIDIHGKMRTPGQYMCPYKGTFSVNTGATNLNTETTP